MIKEAIRFVKGTCTVEVTSAYTERFLNMCWAGDVELWDIRRLGGDKIMACMTAAGYLRVRELEKKCMCSIRVVKREGLACFLKPFARRYFLLTAALLCIILCRLSSCFIWQVSIKGCKTISQRELSAQLAQLGLERGRLISALDLQQIKLDIMTERDDIGYITINISGTKATVDIKERDESLDMGGGYGPCDIVSDRDGIVKKMQVLEGMGLVKEGDTVTRGDRLVTGVMTSSQGETRLVHSMANITLRTWRSSGAALSSEIYGLEPTGRKRSFYRIELGQRSIKVYVIEKKPFAWYYKTKETLRGTGEDGFLPFVRIIKETYYECQPQRLTLSEDKCRDILMDTCRRNLESALGDGRIVSSDFEYVFENGRIRGVLKAECEETAGREAEISQTGEEQVND